MKTLLKVTTENSRQISEATTELIAKLDAKLAEGIPEGGEARE